MILGKKATEIAINDHYDYVICGHIHQPADKIWTVTEKGSVHYLNSGDWIENLSWFRIQPWRMEFKIL